MNTSRIAKVGAAVALVLIGVTACNNHASNNTSNVEPTGPASIIQFPHGFRNVAYKCSGTTMVYSLSAAVDDSLPGGLAVVPNDPRCR